MQLASSHPELLGNGTMQISSKVLIVQSLCEAFSKADEHARQW